MLRVINFSILLDNVIVESPEPRVGQFSRHAAVIVPPSFDMFEIRQGQYNLRDWIHSIDFLPF